LNEEKDWKRGKGGGRRRGEREKGEKTGKGEINQ
jgi:hypothetical protein